MSHEITENIVSRCKHKSNFTQKHSGETLTFSENLTQRRNEIHNVLKALRNISYYLFAKSYVLASAKDSSEKPEV
jgi:hypothetical protein